MSRTMVSVQVVPPAAVWDDSGYVQIGDAVDVSIYASLSLFIIIYQAPTGTNPGLDIAIEHSADGIVWNHLVQMPRIALGWGTTGSYSELDGSLAYPRQFSVSVPGPGDTDTQTFGRYIRLMERTTGTSPMYTGSATLVLRD
jgi:hypothetical protein